MLGKALKEKLSENFKVHAFSKSELDITDFKKIKLFFENLKPDFCVNAAAFTAVDAAETKQTLAKKINDTAVGWLADTCQNHGATLIHFSTDYIFDGENKSGFAENDKPRPLNFYGKTKLAGENKILKSGCKFAIVRTSWLFGNGKNFVNTMLDLAKKNSEIKVVSDQFGSPTFTSDLAVATAKILHNKLQGIFHRTNNGVTSWANFAQKIFELEKLPVKIIPITGAEFPTPAHRPQNSILVNTKLPPLRKWEDSLQEFLK